MSLFQYRVLEIAIWGRKRKECAIWS